MSSSLSSSSVRPQVRRSSSDFEFEFAFRVRVRISGYKFPGSTFEFSFWELRSFSFRVHLGTYFRHLSGSQKVSEKDHPRQRANSEHTAGGTNEKEGVASIRFHSPISFTLPLSSFGWLRNNSSSHRCSASFRNFSCELKRPCSFRNDHFFARRIGWQSRK